jgi:hypothetical protein
MGYARRRWCRMMAAGLVAALFVAACCCPAVRVSASLGRLGAWPEEQVGLTVLIFGWLTPYLPAWVANPALLAGWLALLREECRWAVGLGMAAFALGLTAWPGLLESTERSSTSPVLIGLDTGYYLWMSSMVVLVFGAVVGGGPLHGHNRAGPRPSASGLQPPSDSANETGAWKGGGGDVWP